MKDGFQSGDGGGRARRSDIRWGAVDAVGVLDYHALLGCDQIFQSSGMGAINSEQGFADPAPQVFEQGVSSGTGPRHGRISLCQDIPEGLRRRAIEQRGSWVPSATLTRYTRDDLGPSGRFATGLPAPSPLVFEPDDTYVRSLPISARQIFTRTRTSRTHRPLDRPPLEPIDAEFQKLLLLIERD